MTSLRTLEGSETGRTAPARHDADLQAELIQHLTREVGPARFSRYFTPDTRLDCSSRGVDVHVPSGFHAERLKGQFGDAIRRAGEAALGDRSGSVRVRFCVQPQDHPAGEGRQPAPDQPELTAPPRSHRRHAARVRYRLEEFVVGGTNRLAFEAARRLALGDERSPAQVCVYGPCGAGKTHLLRGVSSMARRRGAARVHCTTGEAFTNRFIAAVREGRLDAFRSRFRGVDLLCIDDVHFVASKEKTMCELLHTLDALDLDGSRVMLVTDAHPSRLRGLDARLASRVLGGLVVGIEPPDATLAVQLAHVMLARLGVSLEDGAMERFRSWCSSAVDRGRLGAREIEGMTKRVLACARIASCPLDRVPTEVVARALHLSEGTAPAQNGRPPTVRCIMGAVCELLEIDRELLTGQGRHRRVVLARQLCSHLAQELTAASYPEIARAFGRRGHSTFVCAAQRMRSMIEGDAPCQTPDGPVGAALLAARAAGLARDRAAREWAGRT